MRSYGRCSCHTNQKWIWICQRRTSLPPTHDTCDVAPVAFRAFGGPKGGALRPPFWGGEWTAWISEENPRCRLKDLPLLHILPPNSSGSGRSLQTFGVEVSFERPLKVAEQPLWQKVHKIRRPRLAARGVLSDRLHFVASDLGGWLWVKTPHPWLSPENEQIPL